MNVIFTAHERKYGEDDGDLEVYPDLTPSTRSIFEGAVDIIGRMYTKEVEDKTGRKRIERRLLVGPHETYISKDRSGSLGRIFKNPTFPRIMQAIKNGSQEGSK